MNIDQTAEYLTENFPRSKDWNYHSVYKTIYRAESQTFTPENPPDGFLPWTKVGGEWMTFPEWIDSAILGRRKAPDARDVADVAEQPQTSPETSQKPKRRKPPKDFKGQWGRV